MKKTVFALTGISLLAATAAMAQPAERTSAPMTRAEVSQKSAERFQKMDLNGDGVLDLADRELRREQRIARIDTDGNGAISAAEREAAREARQERRAERREARGLDAERAGEGKRGKRERNASRTDEAAAKEAAESSKIPAATVEPSIARSSGSRWR